MRPTTKVDTESVIQSNGDDPVIRFPIGEPMESAAGALAEFIEEARTTLTILEEALKRSGGVGPGRGFARAVLQYLSRHGSWVDFHNLPSMGGLDRSGARTLIARLEEEGLVTLERNQSYPNMISLRIAPEGLEELRRLEVAEAMRYIVGSVKEPSHLETAAGQALDALRGLTDAVQEGAGEAQTAQHMGGGG